MAEIFLIEVLIELFKRKKCLSNKSCFEEVGRLGVVMASPMGFEPMF